MLPIEDLVGNVDAARRLVEWLQLCLGQPELLTRLGGSARLGVLVTGPEGVGKLTLARSAAAAVSARTVELAAPGVAALEAARGRAAGARGDLRGAGRRPGRAAHGTGGHRHRGAAAGRRPAAAGHPGAGRAADRGEHPGVALVATTAAPESVDPRLRAPGLMDRELGLPLPDVRVRTELLRRLLAGAAGRRGGPAGGGRAGARVRGR